MLNLTVPIYQGGAEYSAIRLNKESEGQQRLNVEQVRDQVQANVIQAWGQLQAAKAQVEAAIRQNDAARRLVRPAHAGRTLRLCLTLSGCFGAVEREPELCHRLFGAVAAR